MVHSSTSGAPTNSSGDPPVQNDTPINNNEQLININLKVQNFVTVQVRSDDPIRNLKLIGIKEGVSENLQELFYGDRFLEDELTLEYYGIEKDDTITVELNNKCEVARRLFIKIPSNKHLVEVYAREDDTIHIVKSLVVIKAELKSDQFDLMSQGKLLKSYQTLALLNLPNDVVLYLVPGPIDTQLTQVGTYSRGVFTMEVKMLQTIADLKLLLTSMTNLAVEGAKLFHVGKELKDLRTVYSYAIHEDDIVQLVTTIPVHVRLCSGELVTVDVYPSDDSRDVAAKIFKKYNLPYCEHPLIFNDECLVENRPLAHYSIVEGSILRMGTLNN